MAQTSDKPRPAREFQIPLFVCVDKCATAFLEIMAALKLPAALSGRSQANVLDEHLASLA
jgi:hypothetical protein